MAHWFARHIKKSFDAQHIKLTHNLNQAFFQRGGIRNRIKTDDKTIKIVVVMVVTVIMMGWTTIKIILGRGPKTQQNSIFNAGMIRRDDLDRWAFKLRANIGFNLDPFRVAEKVGFVQHNHVCAMKLFFKQFFQRAFVIKVIICFALSLNRVMVMGEKPIAQCRPIKNRDHAINSNA